MDVPWDSHQTVAIHLSKADIPRLTRFINILEHKIWATLQELYHNLTELFGEETLANPQHQSKRIKKYPKTSPTKECWSGKDDGLCLEFALQTIDLCYCKELRVVVVKQTFVGHSGSNHSALYLYRATNLGLCSTLYYVHVQSFNTVSPCHLLRIVISEVGYLPNEKELRMASPWLNCELLPSKTNWDNISLKKKV